MTFSDCPTSEALGAILAHSLQAGDTRLRKGRELSKADIDLLIETGHQSVTVVRLEADDLDEDTAAATIAAELQAPYMSLSAPFTGRANLYADSAGIVSVDASIVHKLNGIDDAITLATVPHMARVSPRQMLATLKIIPYGAPGEAVSLAKAAAKGAIQLHPFQNRSVTLIQTRLPATSDRMMEKGADVTSKRLARLGLHLDETLTCAHKTSEIAEAVKAATGDLILILGASATSDHRDVCPSGLITAGGTLTRFGMPVDPGNLLFLGKLGARDVVGLPGCARSPALNGADWVLERLTAGLTVSSEDIAAMGVGGLLKEIATRPQPRGGNTKVPQRPRIEGIILAAGASSRMRGKDKLMEAIDGVPQLARITKAAMASDLDRVQVILPQDAPARRAALADQDVAITVAKDAALGMSASVRAGLAARSSDSDAVMLILADMPEITADQLNRLIAAFDPREKRTIVQATAADGTPGHPVIFGRRFFESLGAIEGDTGAKSVVQDGVDYLVRVPTDGSAATTDLDTPEAWAAWRAKTQDS